MLALVDQQVNTDSLDARHRGYGLRLIGSFADKDRLYQVRRGQSRLAHHCATELIPAHATHARGWEFWIRHVKPYQQKPFV